MLHAGKRGFIAVLPQERRHVTAIVMEPVAERIQPNIRPGKNVANARKSPSLGSRIFSLKGPLLVFFIGTQQRSSRGRFLRAVNMSTSSLSK